jgi:protein-disulfide isomerase
MDVMPHGTDSRTHPSRSRRAAPPTKRPLRSAVLFALLALAAASAAPAAAQQAESPQLRMLKQAAESRSKGPDGAPVLVYEISDFQCPHCRRFAVDVFPQIDSAYIRTNRVQWVFVSLPMPSHLNSWAAAEAALCAGAVANRFWALHDRLFESHAEWANATQPGPILARYAREAGVPMDAWSACVAEDRVAPLILQDVIFGSRVTGTPTFVVNNQQTVVGVKTFAEWREILDGLLKQR